MSLFNKLFSGSKAAGEGAVGAFNRVGGAVVDTAATGARAVGGAAMGGVGAAAGGAAGVVKGFFKSPVASLKGVVGVAAIAAAIGGAYLAIRKTKTRSSSAEAMTAAAMNDLPPPIAMNPDTMMGMQPQPGQFAAREDARRGAPAGQQLGM
jgi:hypothetical protein